MFQVQPLSQQDPRWKDVRLGYGTEAQATIGQWGCLLTSLAMVANGFGCDETPATMNERMKGIGGFAGALLRPHLMPQVVSGVQYKKRIPSNNPPAPLAEIDAALAAGMPVIVKVDYSPDPGVSEHWIVLYDRQGSDYLMHDPWPFPIPSKKMLLTQKYGFAGGPEKIIRDALFFTGAVQRPVKPKPADKPVPKDALVVYATGDGLALRSEPLVSDTNLIKRMPLHARMFVLEPASAAKAKIGVVNQWLQVQEEAGGAQGFTAAWYVSTTTEPEPVKPQPDTGGGTGPKPDTLVVYATGDGLAVRSQPVIADHNLIKRVPANTEFIVVEPAEQSNNKIGVYGEWLKVRDVTGAEGYVAAWYISRSRQESPLGPRQATPGGSPVQDSQVPDKLVVRTTDEGVALRRQPILADSTLIKRQPLSAELIVLESLQEAETKIGVVNQWLRVRDIYGDEGYVAGWYVVKSPFPGTP